MALGAGVMIGRISSPASGSDATGKDSSKGRASERSSEMGLSLAERVQRRKEAEGRDLAPLLKNPAAAWDHPAFTIWSEDGKTATGTAIRTEKWRYAEYSAGGAMLIDPAADPHELKNLADDPAFGTVRASLSEKIAAFLTKEVGRKSD